MKKFGIVFFTLVASSALIALARPVWEDPDQGGEAVVRKLDDGSRVRLDAVAKDIFRVRRTRGAVWTESGMNRYGVIPRLKADASAVKRREFGFSTSALSVEIGETGNIAFSSAVSPVKMTVSTGLTAAGGDVAFPLSAEDRVYGLGDVSRDNIQRRPGRYEIWVKNVNSYIPIPMAITSSGWGVLLNTTRRNFFDVGKSDPKVMRCEIPEGDVDFYVFVGRDYAALLEAYTRLTGRPALLPVFGYGFTYVCNQWIDQFALMREAQEFRDRELPCDVIGLEPGWMEHFYDFTTRKRWDPHKFFFPSWNPRGRITFTRTLEQRMGFKLSLWLCCDYDLYRYEEELVGGKVAPIPSNTVASAAITGETFHDKNIEDGAAVHDTRTGAAVRRRMSDEIFPKKTVPEGSEPWFEHLKTFVDMGARCFKLDGSCQVTPHDPARKWANGMTTEEAHNLYPLVYDKQMAVGYENHAKKRAMVYSAGGYAGVQQYVATWAGDTGGGPRSLVSCLNLGASGHSNQSCDMTLFDGNNRFRVAGVHFGFLQPWSQQNNWDYWDQPWYQPKEDFETFREYVRLRYRLIPYLYGAAAKAARTGWPMMHPLCFVHPERDEYANLSSTYYLGDSLVVACYTDTAHLPPGVWYDWWTCARVTGPVKVPLNLSNCIGGGLFVKAGAIIPMLPKGVQHIERGWHDTVELHVWAGADGEAEWYEDDGDSLAYRNGAYAITPLSFKGGVLTIGARQGSFAGMPTSRFVRVIRHDERGQTVIGECEVGATGATF